MDQIEKLIESTKLYLSSLISEVSELNITDTDLSTPFQELGIDSFSVLQVIKKLEDDFGTLPKTLLFENFNINDLSTYFVNKHEEVISAKFSNLQHFVAAPIPFKDQLGDTLEVKREKLKNTTKEQKGEIEAKRPVKRSMRTPIIVLEIEAVVHPELKDWYATMFTKYKNEGSASRGTRNIAPYLFIGSEKKGYLNYNKNNNIILVYAYTGPRDYFTVIAQEIAQYCIDNGLEITILSDYAIESVGADSYYSTPFGIISRIDNLKDFTLQGKAMRRLRYQVSKFEKSGNCKTVEYINGTNKETDKTITILIDEWCAPRTMVNPLIHLVREEIKVGKLSAEHRLFLTYLDNVLQNAILISSLSSEMNGYLMDLEFYPKDMPLGGLEYGIIKIIETLAAEGCDMLSLGGTYGCKLEESNNADPDMDKTLEFLREKKLFNDEGNLQFKNKFRPEHQTIFICRPKSIGNADNVTDVIMMIADPSKTNVTEENTYTKLSLEIKVEEKNTAVPVKIDVRSEIGGEKNNLTNADEGVMIEGEQRSLLLANFNFNPLTIPDSELAYNLKTDSWAQLDSPAIDKQLNFLHSQLYQPVHIEESLQKLFPFLHLAFTSSGRNAEKAFFKSWTKKGKVIQNLLFPTAIFSQIENGFLPLELPHDTVFDLKSEEIFKGNLKWDTFEEQLIKEANSISLVAIELSDNAAGGAPVSLGHLKKVKKLLIKYSVPLVIDGTRVLENAKFIIEHEKGYERKSLWKVAKEIFSVADAVWVSLAKDFCVNKGGIVATNNEALFKKLQEVVQDEGIGLDIIDKKLIAHSFAHQNIIENLIVERIKNVRSINEKLAKHGIPIVKLAGSHCILIDVKQLSQFTPFENPVASFLAWMFLNTGILGGAHSAGMQKNTHINNLVRLSIPIGLERNKVNEISTKLIDLFDKMENIPELVIAGNTSETSLMPVAKFKLKGYHNVATNLIPIPTGSSVAQEPMHSAENKDYLTVPEVEKESSTIGNASDTNKEASKDIAIVGMSGRYPKAKNLDELWNNLLEGKDCIETIPEERLQQRSANQFSKKYRGGFLTDVDKFDSMFFNIPPAVAEMFDPQERLLLETAWESIEDAGYYPEILTPDGAPKNIGVFVGAVWTMYQMIGAEEKMIGHDTNPNSFLWSVANRISYSLNLSGPSLSVDTACSSSMTALYLACEAIYNGECSGAIVGGVNLDLHQSKFDINSFGGALSPDGVCRSFGKGANGYVAGEGVGTIFIKSLEQAEKDGDHIYGVIKSVSVNHGGRTSGYMVPDPKAQANLVQSALKKAGIDARSLGYIEAHGTGTELGDPIEIAGLTTAFEKYAVKKQSCAIGSVKTNIGHLEAAAAVVGIQKVLLQMKHKTLVPSLHSSELNEFIDFENSPFYVEQKVEGWKPKTVDGVQFPLRAGISSFGAGGANAHVIIESYERKTKEHPKEGQPNYQIFPLSAVKEHILHESAIRLRSFVEKDISLDVSKQLSIDDIGHTLRIGRKSFEHRLVILAATKQELVTKLSLFIEGKKDNGILKGAVQNAGSFTRLLNSSERKAFIKLVSESGDLQKLGQLWIEGITNDWQGLSSSVRNKRVPLPTYPFADKRHWVERKENVVGASSIQYPLLDTNESTFERQIFKKTFRDNEFFIYDHLVSDIPTLPGVAYLDFARKAGELAAGRKVKSIKNIIWLNPISVVDSVPVDIWIELIPQGEQVKFEVYGKNGDGVKQLHSQGRLAYFSEESQQFEPEYIDVKSIQERCVKVLDGKDAYPLFKTLGLGLGPSFQVLQEVYKNEDEMLGIMKIPDVCLNDFEDFLLHPSIVDGAGQTAMAAHLSDSEKSGEMFVPYSFGEVEIHNPLTPTCYSYIQKANEPNSKLSKANLIILDETGKVLVKINESVGIPLTDIHEKSDEDTMRALQTSEKEEDEFSKLYYTHVWEPSSILIKESSEASVEHILIFDTDEAFYNSYKERPETKGNKVVLVQPGQSYEESSKRNTYKVQPTSINDLVRLLESLEKKEIRFSKICYAWSKTPFQHEVTFLKESLEKGVYSFLCLCQSLIGSKADHMFQLVYLYYGSEDDYQPHNEAVSGFAKSLHLENSDVICKTVEIQSKKIAIANVVNVVDFEFRKETNDELAVRYTADERFVRKLKNIHPWANEKLSISSQFALKERGVYLITGGTGGLGFIFAEFLAKQCKAKLILTGRSELSEGKLAKIKEIEALGSEVFYEPTDVSNPEEIYNLLAKSKAKFGAINGLVHAAGVLRDSNIRNKTIAEMRAVFAPKVFGTFYLDEATKNENLDFFVTFSSMAAVGGNMGQSDYSYANHFMDTFARRRANLQKTGGRSGKSLSLNWSIWADGGMKLDAQMELFFKNKLGIRPLSLDTGIGAFCNGLLSDETQIVVAEGMQERMEIAWGIRKEEVASEVEEPKTLAPISPLPTADANDEAIAAVQQGLIQIAMDFLKLEEDDVSIDKILLDIGFDSIGLASYANALNDKYRLETITPVLFFEYPSIREIAKYLTAEHHAEVMEAHSMSSAAGRDSEQMTKPKTQVVVKEEVASGFSGINKGWNAKAFDQKEMGISSKSGISADSRFVDCPIAIVGVGGVMPKSRNMEEYWENLKNGENMISVIPRDRWIWEDFDGDPITEKNKTNSKYGGFIEDADKFDPLFFGISPREAEMMDPQQRVFLETVWSTIEDSGYKVSDLSGTKTGLFVGVAVHDYSDLMNTLNIELDGYTASGNSHCMLANRISFLLNLRGPSAPIDTACSSSLIAIHRAIESIHTGSSDMAIVGGVQLMMTPAAHISFGMAGMLSSDGKCKTFDKDANGYVRGEGSGAVFLKPLAKAEADNDQIYAVIKSTAENHGGRATMLTAPNPHAQSELLVEAYEKAQIDPTTVGYVECHGTGTSLGDPIEIRALIKSFKELYQKFDQPAPKTPHIGLSSVKTNIGHLETAAGISSFLKVVLAIKHKQIPASLHFENLNPHIDLSGSPFHIIDKTTAWRAIKGKDGKEVPLRAGVSSFGFGGANAHVVLEEYRAPLKQTSVAFEGPYSFVLSAKNKERLPVYAQSILNHIEKKEVELFSLIYTLQVGRDAMAERLAFTVNSLSELKQKLKDYCTGSASNESVFVGKVSRKLDDALKAISIDDLIANHQFSEILKVWVQGVDVDWNRFYGEVKPKRINIPTYPFSKERYWFEFDSNNARVKEQAVLHPLLHKNTSVLTQQSYSSSFSENDFFLIDYQKAKEKTLSVGGYLEMAYEAVLHATSTGSKFVPMEFSNVQWSTPFSLSDSKTISIALFEEDGDRVAFKGFGIQDDGEQIHYEGTVKLMTIGKPQKISLELLNKQMNFGEIPQNGTFGSFEQMASRNSTKPEVTSFAMGHNQTLTHVVLTGNLENDATTFVLNPTIVECCLATAGLLIDTDKYSDHPPFPTKLEQLKVVSPCVAEMFVWTRHSRGKEVSDHKAVLDVDIFDKQGNICVSLKSLTFINDSSDLNAPMESGDLSGYLASVYDLLPNGGAENLLENIDNEFEKLLDGDFS